MGKTFCHSFETGRKSYFFYNEYKAYNEANNKCNTNHNGSLAIIKDEKQEFNELVENSPKENDEDNCFDSYYMIGLNKSRQNSRFEWLDGSYFQNESRNISYLDTERDCNVAVLYTGKGNVTSAKFQTWGCTKPYFYICEKNKTSPHYSMTAHTQESTKVNEDGTSFTTSEMLTTKVIKKFSTTVSNQPVTTKGKPTSSVSTNEYLHKPTTRDRENLSFAATNAIKKPAFHFTTPAVLTSANINPTTDKVDENHFSAVFVGSIIAFGLFLLLICGLSSFLDRVKRKRKDRRRAYQINAETHPEVVYSSSIPQERLVAFSPPDCVSAEDGLASERSESSGTDMTNPQAIKEGEHTTTVTEKKTSQSEDKNTSKVSSFATSSVGKENEKEETNPNEPIDVFMDGEYKNTTDVTEED